MEYPSKIVIHINEDLDSKHRIKLSDQVQEKNGVVSASLHEKRTHLMIVAYDPSETKAYDVLNGVRNSGMHAQLIAWL